MPLFTGWGHVGIQAFVLAPMGFLYNHIPIAISWLSNITFIIALINGNLKTKVIFSLLSILLGLVVLIDPEIDITTSPMPMRNTLSLAYYCWLLSFTILFINYYSIYLNQKKSHPLPDGINK